MDTYRVFPPGNPEVDTNGTYGYAVLPDGFVQQPWSATFPELMVGSYAPGTGQDFYFFPNNPERGTIVPGGVALLPSGDYAPDAHPAGPTVFNPEPLARIGALLGSVRRAPKSGREHEVRAELSPLWQMSPAQVNSIKRLYPRTLWEAIYPNPYAFE